MAALPLELQWNIVTKLQNSLDLDWDVSYIYEKPGEELKRYRASYEYAWQIKGRWAWMARSFFAEHFEKKPNSYYLSKLMDAFCQGYVHKEDTRLWVDAYELLGMHSSYFSRAKRIIGITRALGIVDCIKFNIWKYFSVSEDYQIIPQSLCNEHFGCYLVSNPHQVRIEYDVEYQTARPEQQIHLTPWHYYIMYNPDNVDEEKWWRFQPQPLTDQAREEEEQRNAEDEAEGSHIEWAEDTNLDPNDDGWGPLDPNHSSWGELPTVYQSWE